MPTRSESPRNESPRASFDARDARAGTDVHSTELDLSRSFMPEALSGATPLRALDGDDLLRLNQIRASSYLHLFERFESLLANAARSREHARNRPTLEPLLRDRSTEHRDLFRAFQLSFRSVFPVSVRHVSNFEDFERTLHHASPLALLVLALHLKLVTQQHYLACLRSDEPLEPHFVDVLREHWNAECGPPSRSYGSALAIERALSIALPARVPGAMRDYRLLVFAGDDVLRRQALLDVETLERARAGRLDDLDRANVVAAQGEAHRKAFLTVGIVNAAFVYAMRGLGPSVPATLAGVVSALSSRP